MAFCYTLSDDSFFLRFFDDDFPNPASVLHVNVAWLVVEYLDDVAQPIKRRFWFATVAASSDGI
jgi:hypothetical protein